jgi:hypothetical protein
MIYELNKVDIKPGFRSDHSLIEINFQGNDTCDRGPSYWRFNANLLKNLEYTNYMNTRIDEIIQKYEGMEDPGMKWELIKMEIRSSTICFSKKNAIKNKENINNLIKKYSELEREIAEHPNDTILEEYNEIKADIEYYNNEKAMGAMVRSKADWTEFGEKNTKYFLNLEKINYKNKCITKLIDENGAEINNSEKILEYEAEYYKKL